MFAFITSVRHPTTSLSYARIEALLKRTLRSVCNQTNGNFRVIVVCNQLPTNPVADDRISYLISAEPPIETDDKLLRVRIDKGTKLALGLAAARDYSPQHIMFFDADDFVHCGIVDYSETHRTDFGWYVERGFVYDQRTGLISPIRQFNEICGTSHIVSYGLVEPRGILPTSSRTQILNTLGEDYVALILGAHPFLVRYFAKRGNTLSPLPFNGAVYVRGTGENDRRYFTAPGFPRPPSRRFCRNFGISLSLMNQCRACVTWPRAVAEHVGHAVTGGVEMLDSARRESDLQRVLRIP